MKKIIIMSCLSFATAFTSIAQDNSRANERATNLTNRMIRDLRLNNYQASRLRAINLEKVNEMMELEERYAGNPEMIEKACKGVCKDRDKEVESFLSVDQYSQYYAGRSEYYKADREFASKIGLKNNTAGKSKAARLPLGEKASPAAGTHDPVLRPADTR